MYCCAENKYFNEEMICIYNQKNFAEKFIYKKANLSYKIQKTTFFFEFNV